MNDQKTTGFETPKAHISEAASDLMHEGKKLVNDLYEDGLDKVGEAQKCAQEYSKELTQKIHKNPLGAILIAAGVGFLLSSLLRK